MIVQELHQLDREARRFVHKRILGAAGGFLTGGPAGAARGFITSGGGGEPPQGSSVVPGAFTPGESSRMSDLRFRCRQKGGTLRANGTCDQPGFQVGSVQVNPLAALPFGDPLFSRAGGDPGVAVMGRYGAALAPVGRAQTVSRCLRGMVLGNDGLCYNKRDIKNSERMWPAGRRPLLTGGDLNAISKAARAATRVKTTTKRLQKLGLLAKPKPAARRKSIGPGGEAHHHHG